ncbi:MAG TPA: VWA domain-containing protein [Candidatus Babeliales bacterium]|nr:VWA domain-containing protein [Candidatus Babeliales bacterium]
MIITITSIHWAAFQNIWYFFFVMIVGLLLIVRYKKQRTLQRLLVGSHHNFLQNVSVSKRLIKSLLLCIGSVFLCLSLLRPQWNKSEEIITQEGRDLYIALDISRSMLATDCAPNRLIFAKEKIKRLVEKLACERVGLILFSGSAFVQCPLTSDYAAFYLYLDAVDAELISSGSTALAEAIQQALLSFSATPERKNKLLVLFTDGEDFSHNLHNIKQEAIQANLSTFTIGIGTPQGAPVPLFDHYGTRIGHQKDVQGNVVISRLNEDILRTISQGTGGQYICATNNDEDITLFLRMINAFDKEQLAERKHARYEDQYHYFLLITFICFVFEWLL